MRKRTKIALALSVVVFGGIVAVPPVVPLMLSWHRPDIRFSSPTKEKRIFLTIDDAPSKNTGAIIEVLRKHGVPATFFVIADRVKSPSELQGIVAAGCSLGNHLRTTRACSTLTLEEFKHDFDACSNFLDAVPHPRLFRPASDFGTQEQIAYAKSKGYEAVMGSVYPLDHWLSDPGLLVFFARWLTIPGGIVIMHDGDSRGHTTAAVLDRLIPKLRDAGYSFGVLEGVNPALQPR